MNLYKSIPNKTNEMCYTFDELAYGCQEWNG